MYYSDGDSDVSQIRKFSRFNDSMKINKRRMSREEKPIRPENIQHLRNFLLKQIFGELSILRNTQNCKAWGQDKITRAINSKDREVSVATAAPVQFVPGIPQCLSDTSATEHPAPLCGSIMSAK